MSDAEHGIPRTHQNNIFLDLTKRQQKNNILFHTDSPVIVVFFGESHKSLRKPRMIAGWPDIFPTCQVHDLHDVMDSRQNLGHAATFKKWRSPGSSSWNHQKKTTNGSLKNWAASRKTCFWKHRRCFIDATQNYSYRFHMFSLSVLANTVTEFRSWLQDVTSIIRAEKHHIWWLTPVSQWVVDGCSITPAIRRKSRVSPGTIGVLTHLRFLG